MNYLRTLLFFRQYSSPYCMRCIATPLLNPLAPLRLHVRTCLGGLSGFDSALFQGSTTCPSSRGAWLKATS
jgi:hypothetical protein